MSEIRDYIIDHVGADNWQQVIEEFAQKTLEQIKETLNFLWPTEENDNLAQKIYNEVNRS